MNKLALTFIVFCLLVSEANAAKNCNCVWWPTDEQPHICTKLNYHVCLDTVSCETYGKTYGKIQCGMDLECTPQKPYVCQN